MKSEIEEVPFVGDERGRLVELLLHRYDASLTSAEACRVVVLEGESGTGKSRVVREFYKALRRQQSGGLNGYWPQLPTKLNSRNRSGDDFALRKQLGPGTRSFVRSPGSLPDFSWWTLACESYNEATLVSVADELMSQGEAHARFYAEKIKKEMLPAEKFQKWKKERLPTKTLDLGHEAGVEGLSKILATFDLALPGAGFVAANSAELAKRMLENRKIKKDIISGGGLHNENHDPRKLLQTLAGFSHRKFPMIIAIEDLHLINDDLYRLLCLLGEEELGKPILVVSTSWPNTSNSNYLDLVSGHPHVERIEMRDIETSALVHILHQYAPNTDNATAFQIAEHWTNPLALQLMLTDDGINNECVEDGAIHFKTRDQIQNLPNSILAWFWKRWESLPDEHKVALMVAIACLPSEAVHQPSAWPFVIDVVAQARASDTSQDSEQERKSVEVALTKLASSHEWLVPLQSADMLSFSEWAMARIAGDMSQRDLRFAGDNERNLKNRVAEILSKKIEEWAEQSAVFFNFSSGPDLQFKTFICAWLLKVADPEERSVGLSVAALNYALREQERGLYAAALKLLDGRENAAASTENEKHRELYFSIRGLKAYCLWAEGDPRLLEYLEALESDQVSTLGAHHPMFLNGRAQTTMNLILSGHLSLEQGIQALEEVAESLVESQNTQSSAAFTTQIWLAYCLHLGGNTDRAQENLEEIILRSSDTLGKDAPATQHAQSLLSELANFDEHSAAANFRLRELIDEHLAKNPHDASKCNQLLWLIDHNATVTHTGQELHRILNV